MELREHGVDEGASIRISGVWLGTMSREPGDGSQAAGCCRKQGGALGKSYAPGTYDVWI